MRSLNVLSAVFGLLTIAVRGAGPDIFARGDLVAWCIVPFDAKKRGPEERAVMLEKLGLKRLAYDYRAEHIPQFDAEMEALKRHGIELTAWWFPTTMNDEARHILDVIKRHRVHPQLWVMGSGERVEDEAARLRPICQAAAAQELKVALYNHGGWFGEPENQIAIIERLKRDGVTNAGIVYNLHHGHGHVDRFPALLQKMKPYLLALNLNGMIRDGEAKGQMIVPLAQGELDLSLLKTIKDSGWRGPVGILNHTDEDAEARLLDNLEGLDWLLKEVEKPGSAGPKPTPRSWKPVALRSGADPPAFRGKVIAGDTRFRQFPLTVECRAKLNSATGFNILVACDPKSSAEHWELYSYAGAGDLSAYLPGRGGEVRSGVNICDGKPHTVGAVLEYNRVRLYVDNREVKSAPLRPVEGEVRGSGIALGRLVEGGIGCDGELETVRIRRGDRDLTNPSPLTDTAPGVIDLWQFPAATGGPAPQPASFPFDAAPLDPALWPNRSHPVNRERLYDFYTKQARYFMAHQPAPPLLAEFPGLDGGKLGHWGNQNEDTWRDNRLNEMDCGPCVCGVFRGAGLTIPKAICLRLGEKGDHAMCFDPEQCEFRVEWEGGFVKFSDTRHGLMDGLHAAGKSEVSQAFLGGVPRNRSVKPRFLGYYRNGPHTVFSWKVPGDDKYAMYSQVRYEKGTRYEFSDSDDPLVRATSAQLGKDLPEERLHTPSGFKPGDVIKLTKGGPAQWPQVLATTGTLGKPVVGWPYVVDTLTLPFDNPWKTLFFVSGHDFFSNGDIALCTITGDVWRVSGIDESLAKLRWKRMAAGLHQPLGLVVVDDKVCVLGRDQITRLHDLNGDGEADFYECLTNNFDTPTGGHDFICGLERDAAGNFYTASCKDGLLRISPRGDVKILATGFRNPDGLGLGPDGTLTVPMSEGEWTPASSIAQISEGGFYGYGGPRQGVPVLQPLLRLPRGVDNSSGAQTWVPDDRWGPLRGQMIHLSYGAGTHFLVLRQFVQSRAARDGGAPGGIWQGAAVPLPGDFESGVHRARFSPHDGQLYVSGMTGWGTYASKDGCLQRVRYTGGPVQLPVAFEARDNGVLLTFSDKLDATAANPAAHFAQCWAYRYSSAYGSPEFSLRFPDTPGHDVLEITSAHILPDGKRLFLEIPQLQPAPQIHLLVQPQPGMFRELFLTAHTLALPFTDFPGYKVIAKTTWTTPATAVIAARPNPFTSGPDGRPVRVETAAALQFATKEIGAGAGERLSLTLSNPDTLPHNWVLLKPGSMDRIGDLANKLITDPDGASRHYVPDSPDVLAWTDMVNPGAAASIRFNAPAVPGDYPYICTFPGHWMLMRGVLRISGPVKQ